MVTLTFPHYQWQQLSDLVAQRADALQKLRAGNPWTKFKQRMGYRGLIRSLELTYGDNGWHPHTHELWFVRADAEAEDMKAKILDRWEKCCARAGLLDLDNAGQVEAFRAHAVDVKGNCSASEYLAKQDDSRHWGRIGSWRKDQRRPVERRANTRFGCWRWPMKAINRPVPGLSNTPR